MVIKLIYQLYNNLDNNIDYYNMNADSLIAVIENLSFDSKKNATLSTLAKLANVTSDRFVDILNLYSYDSGKKEAFVILCDNNQFDKKYLRGVLETISYDSGRKSILDKVGDLDSKDDLPSLLNTMSYDEGKLDILKRFKGRLSIKQLYNVLDTLSYDNKKVSAVEILATSIDNDKKESMDSLTKLSEIVSDASHFETTANRLSFSKSNIDSIKKKLDEKITTIKITGGHSSIGGFSCSGDSVTLGGCTFTMHPGAQVSINGQTIKRNNDGSYSIHSN